MTGYLPRFLQFNLLVVLHASQDGHKTTLTCKKWHIYTYNIYIYIYMYVKLNYCDYPNKNEQPNLRITKSWVQQK